MHITLTGNLGSGKSTICRIMSGEYGYSVYSTGVIQRKLAEDMGLNVLEMNKLMCGDAKYDNMIDNAVAKISTENPEKKLVFDSRLAWHFAPVSFKIFLSVSLSEAARRVYADSRGEVEKYKSEADCRDNLKQRADTENMRYKDIYKLDYFNLMNYNLVLDSTYARPEELAAVIIREKELYEAAVQAGEKPGTRLLMSPKRLGAAIEKTSAEDSEGAEEKNAFYSDDLVVIRPNDEDFEVVEGQAVLHASAKAGLLFVNCLLA